MNELEQLMAEYDNELTFKFRDDMPDTLSGIIIDRTIHINSKLPFERAVATLAEEIGHYETTSKRNIVDYRPIENSKEEVRARQWSYKKLIPRDKILAYARAEHDIMNYEVAEEFGLPVEIVEEAVEMYRVKGEI